MMASSSEKEDHPKVLYPLDSGSYELVQEIGVGVNAVVYKAKCVPLDSTIVAIKAIDLDNIRRETKIMPLLSHPNILNAHCSFNVDRRLWVVMPFMSGGSLQSIISSSFPDGLPEECIAIVLKEILKALSFLHNQGHLHKDIKAGNILIESNGCVKLGDFGVSASIYETSPSSESRNDSYWMAPEVIHSPTGYNLKAEIWSFGVTALELAHGRPPLYQLPPSKSLIMKITKRFRFSEYECSCNCKQGKMFNKFSKDFKDMVASCLHQDPAMRPSAEKLLEHSLFKTTSKGSDFLVEHVLKGLPSVEERFRLSNSLGQGAGVGNHSGADAHKWINRWFFDEYGMELDPVLDRLSPTESKYGYQRKRVRLGPKTTIPETAGCSIRSGNAGGPEAKSGLMSSQRKVDGEEKSSTEWIAGSECVVSDTENAQQVRGDGLMALVKSMEDARLDLDILIDMVEKGVVTQSTHLRKMLQRLINRHGLIQ